MPGRPATPAAPCDDVSASDRRLLVVTALRLEQAAVRRALPGALVLRCGIGAARARAAVPVITRLQAGAVAVAGVCGALDGDLRAGDIVVGSEVRGPGGVVACSSEPLVAALSATGVRRVHVGPILSVDHIVRGAERAALRADGALVVDMESAWLAPGAAGGPFAVLRVVLDTPERGFSWPLATLGDAVVAWRALRRAAPALAIWAR